MTIHECCSLLLTESSFHNPSLKIEDEKKKKIVEREMAGFMLTKCQLERVKREFQRQIELGLLSSPHEKSCLQMENTFLHTLPDGTEKGDFLSMDLGSTNFRVLLSRLRGGPEDDFRVKYYAVPPELRRGDSTKLFDFFADCLANFIETYADEGLKSKALPLAFTFSFPVRQNSLDDATLITWTKSFDCPDAVNKNIVELVRQAIERKKLNIKVVALLNDTTATLVKGAYLDPNCAVGLILGSGSNACYIEAVDKMDKAPAAWKERHRGKRVIIDMECGAFGDNHCIDFVRTEFDKELDQNSLFPGSFVFEKLFGGNFIGEIIRLILVKLIGLGVLFNGRLNEKLAKPYSFRSADGSAIEEEFLMSGWTDRVSKVLKQFDYEAPTKEDLRIVQFVCTWVFIRGALLVSSILAVLIERINQPKVTIAVDGSLYMRHPKFHMLLHDFTRVMSPKHKFKILLAEDGSGKGAGLTAAVAHKNC